ncbi:ribonuclease D [Cryobacterium mesophilum]|uniref:Ribonuclease D n=1 Tax=Terrimesophilobacter mesophilus TaxID=433647 RepID=A0A4R8V9M0_9MICO|nr:HRDC domain-containing protein [Terrimesophilobacter mesophilus]MBB5631836.1 ribonuclease D [Terrimesophilobacter mesophilus]TFB78750.1 ribonuclease D [Terrimesophilobacter mesophilus]
MTSEQAPHDPVAVIDSRRGFLTAVEIISAGSGPLAIDAERASGYRYSQRAYLIQVFRRGAGSFLFDPPAIGEFSELQEAVGSVEWILHAASQDLACLREVGLDPETIFDTELGARLAGIPRVGLGSVVEELLGIHLAKEHSAADWSTRPLPQAWLVYAALDVELLVDLRDALAELLERNGKSEIARQEFAATLAKEPKPANPDAWRRLSGLHSLRQPRSLAVARALWTARDEYAREIDTAPGRLLPDLSITAAAKNLPATKSDLAALREFNGRASRSQLPRWWAAIERGMAVEDLPRLKVPSDAIPPVRAWPDRRPEADRRIKAARTAFAALSEELSIPVENLLTPELLRQVAWEPPEPVTVDDVRTMLAAGGARPWQCDATAQVIVDAFVEASQPETEPDTADS